MSLVYKKYKILAFVFTCLTVLFLVLYAAYLGSDAPLKTIYHYTLGPVQVGVQRAWKRVSRLGKGSKRILELEAQVQSLKLELFQQGRLLSAQPNAESGASGDVAKVLSSVGWPANQSFVGASVISKDPQNLFSTLIIDRGRKHEVRSGMPVVGFAGKQLALVGYVYAAGPYSSTVRTILDHRCHVSILIRDRKSVGFMKGQTPVKLSMLVDYIDINLEGLDDEWVVTSGFGRKYPKNIAIGRITETSKKGYGYYQKAQVSPLINFFTIEDVFVVEPKAISR